MPVYMVLLLPAVMCVCVCTQESVTVCVCDVCIGVHRKVLLCVSVEIEHITSPVSRKVRRFVSSVFLLVCRLCIVAYRSVSAVGLLTVVKPKPRFLARTEENRNRNFCWPRCGFQLRG